MNDKIRDDFDDLVEEDLVKYWRARAEKYEAAMREIIVKYGRSEHSAEIARAALKEQGQ